MGMLQATSSSQHLYNTQGQGRVKQVRCKSVGIIFYFLTNPQIVSEEPISAVHMTSVASLHVAWLLEIRTLGN